MEERKDHYKNNFSQAKDRASDEEQEAEAAEKLRNEYNFNVKELEILEGDKSKSIQILCIIAGIREDQSPTMAKDY